MRIEVLHEKKSRKFQGMFNWRRNSTGSITGNILGAYLGLSGIPADWVNKVELSKVLIQIADDLLSGYQEGQDWWNRYPGY